MQQIPFSQARANLADTLRGVEDGNEPAMISRRGAPAAVLMSVAQFRRLSASAQGFASKLDEWRHHYLDASDTDEASAWPDLWADVRDPAVGRDFKW
ncbi:type II toxin-antitoxin system Phd/YefM family antitoxin [Variovorax sp. dw_954]|uniref:type II toxin-antitoxin system Phd/YefM family antitoxin n=1 Tax=Variovorax sp. dw_954 TaxID=2720078 RepID=UPI0021172198|nr:type II toxin-antitoxin system Phd/YefM family antitoxin [Variovorax sp. dw_954]